MAQGPFNNWLNRGFETGLGGITRLALGGAWMGARGGVRMAPTAAKYGAGAALALGSTAAYTLGAGKAPLDWHSHNLFGKEVLNAAGRPVLRSGRPVYKGGLNFKLPTFNRALQNTLVFGAFAAAAGIGAAKAAGVEDMGGDGWRVSDQAASGAIEIERGGFLGATGSLTLEMGRSRRRQQVQAEARRQNVQGAARLAPYADDALRMVHVARF